MSTNLFVSMHDGIIQESWASKTESKHTTAKYVSEQQWHAKGGNKSWFTVLAWKSPRVIRMEGRLSKHACMLSVCRFVTLDRRVLNASPRVSHYHPLLAYCAAAVARHLKSLGPDLVLQATTREISPSREYASDDRIKGKQPISMRFPYRSLYNVTK
jgi:hypothetical protein